MTENEINDFEEPKQAGQEEIAAASSSENIDDEIERAMQSEVAAAAKRAEMLASGTSSTQESDTATSGEIKRREEEILKQGDEETNVLPDYLNYLWAIYANFEIMISSPYIDTKKPPVIISPAYDTEQKVYESVYPIFDHGYSFSTARGEDAAMGTTAMGKLYRTIQKMIHLVIKRLEEHAGQEGEQFNPHDEVKLALFGYELGRRKAFALIMDLDVNISIVNFDPRIWGEKFITNLKHMIASGYGCPSDLKNVSERVAPGGLIK